MTREEIHIEIDDNGSPTIEVKGCPGPSCKNLTSDLERALGRTVSDQPTKEMHQAGKHVAKQR